MRYKLVSISFVIYLCILIRYMEDNFHHVSLVLVKFSQDWNPLSGSVRPDVEGRGALSMGGIGGGLSGCVTEGLTVDHRDSR